MAAKERKLKFIPTIEIKTSTKSRFALLFCICFLKPFSPIQLTSGKRQLDLTQVPIPQPMVCGDPVCFFRLFFSLFSTFYRNFRLDGPPVIALQLRIHVKYWKWQQQSMFPTMPSIQFVVTPLELASSLFIFLRSQLFFFIKFYSTNQTEWLLKRCTLKLTMILSKSSMLVWVLLMSSMKIHPYQPFQLSAIECASNLQLMKSATLVKVPVLRVLLIGFSQVDRQQH